MKKDKLSMLFRGPVLVRAADHGDDVPKWVYVQPKEDMYPQAMKAMLTAMSTMAIKRSGGTEFRHVYALLMTGEQRREYLDKLAQHFKVRFSMIDLNMELNATRLIN